MVVLEGSSSHHLPIPTTRPYGNLLCFMLIFASLWNARIPCLNGRIRKWCFIVVESYTLAQSRFGTDCSVSCKLLLLNDRMISNMLGRSLWHTVHLITREKASRVTVALVEALKVGRVGLSSNACIARAIWEFFKSILLLIVRVYYDKTASRLSIVVFPFLVDRASSLWVCGKMRKLRVLPLVWTVSLWRVTIWILFLWTVYW